MSSFELAAGDPPTRSLPRSISEVAARDRVVLTGTILKCETVPLGGSVAYECVLEDGAGDLVLVFVGRRSVPGFSVGTRCEVEGRVRSVGGRFEIWNPLYRLH